MPYFLPSYRQSQLLILFGHLQANHLGARLLDFRYALRVVDEQRHFHAVVIGQRSDNINPGVHFCSLIQIFVWDAIHHRLAAIRQAAVDLLVEQFEPHQAETAAYGIINQLHLIPGKLVAQIQEVVQFFQGGCRLFLFVLQLCPPPRGILDRAFIC